MKTLTFVYTAICYLCLVILLSQPVEAGEVGLGLGVSEYSYDADSRHLDPTLMLGWETGATITFGITGLLSSVDYKAYGHSFQVNTLLSNVWVGHKSVHGGLQFSTGVGVGVATTDFTVDTQSYYDLELDYAAKVDLTLPGGRLSPFLSMQWHRYEVNPRSIDYEQAQNRTDIIIGVKW